MQCDVYPVVRLASVIGTNVGVSKNDQLKVLVVPSILPTLLISNEEVSLMY